MECKFEEVLTIKRGLHSSEHSDENFCGLWEEVTPQMFINTLYNNVRIFVGRPGQ